MSSTSKQNFSAKLKELEQCVEALEKPDLPLEQAIQTFEKGSALAATLRKMLDDAKLKVDTITQENQEFTGDGDQDTLDDQEHRTDA